MEKIGLAYSLHFLLPWGCLCCSVATIHDVIYLLCKRGLPNRDGRQYYGFRSGFSSQHASDPLPGLAGWWNRF